MFGFSTAGFRVAVTAPCNEFRCRVYGLGFKAKASALTAEG